MVIDRDSAGHYRWGGDCDGWHLLKGPGLSVIEERVPPGRGESRHYHRHAQQFFNVLSGAAELEVDGATHRLGPGQGLAVAAGLPHSLRNAGEADVRFLVASSPPSQGIGCRWNSQRVRLHSRNAKP